MGFLLTLNELKDFFNTCGIAKESIGCSQCEKNRKCRSILLKTPSDKIDLAVSEDELEQIQELIAGTVFKLDLKQWVFHTGLN